ncbi:unnamed protein product [Brugia timori]|nr:unnamed protein product [Brugia timori]
MDEFFLENSIFDSTYFAGLICAENKNFPQYLFILLVDTLICIFYSHIICAVHCHGSFCIFQK